jgi:ParB-like chromosome segregation protein Spo0J
MPRLDLWTKDHDDIAVQMADTGHTLADIAAKVGRSVDGVRNRLKRHLRPDLTIMGKARDGTAPRTAAPWTEAEDATVMRMLRKGKTIIDAGLVVGRSTEAVRKRLKALRSALVPSTRSAVLARDRPIPPKQLRGAEAQGRKVQVDTTRACRLHLIDLMRSYRADTLGEAKRRYRARCEYAETSGTPTYIARPARDMSYVGSTAAMCSGE